MNNEQRSDDYAPKNFSRLLSDENEHPPCSRHTATDFAADGHATSATINGRTEIRAASRAGYHFGA